MTEIQIERKNLPLGLLVSLSNCPVSLSNVMIGGSRATSDELKVEICFLKNLPNRRIQRSQFCTGGWVY